MKSLIHKLLTESLGEGLSHEVYHKVGSDRYIVTRMYRNGKKVAHADYKVSDGKVHMNLINADVKGHGFGQKLMNYLANTYGYENIDWQGLTDAGAKLKSRMDKHFTLA